MSTALMPFGGEPNYVAGYLYAHVTDFVTAANGYQFTSTAPQAELDAAIVQANQKIAPPLPPEQQNKLTLEQQADAALVSLQAGIDQTNTWRTTGPGAGTANLTSAQLSAASRQSADNQLITMRSLKAVIRLLRGKLDAAN